MKRFASLLVPMLSLSAVAADLKGLGSITFPTSATGPAQEHFLRGVTILHSFGWKQARTEFQAAQEIDPDFAMAYWGESLCYNHPLIGERDLDTPREILQRLGETAEERLAKAPTEREKGFIAAVEALFFGGALSRGARGRPASGETPRKKDDTLARRRAYTAAMRSLHEAYPDDDEVAAFYALSLLMSAGPAGEAMRSNVLAGSIALQLLDRNPHHPGAAHYAIHAFDDPVHAPLALPAAYVFADIAEKVSHARHMPSHIFIQRGMWDRVSASNQSAYEAAVDLWEPGDSLGDMLHSLDWGQYGDLQRGDYDRAAVWIQRSEGVREHAEKEPMVAGIIPQVRARMAIEREAWDPRPVTDDSPATELLATGLGAVHTGDLALAEAAADRLSALAEEASAEDGDRSYYARNSKPLQIMVKEVAGMLAIARGDTEAGLELLAEGVAVAESMRPPNGAPNPLKPVHELHGEALLAADRPREAIDAFEASLLRTPNRPLSLRGLARAHAALGEHAEASALYGRLLQGWQDRDVSWKAEAQTYLAARRGAMPGL